MQKNLKKLTKLLPSPLKQLMGKRGAILSLPDNIVCFCRHTATELNKPQRGRALHHRFVLIMALETGATVRVDDSNVRLQEGHGLLVLPFQFHDYMDATREELQWLFITFDMVNDGSLEGMRFQPFAISPEMMRVTTELVSVYLKTKSTTDDLTTLLLAQLLTHIKRSQPAVRRQAARTVVNASVATGMMTMVNELAENRAMPPSVKEIASAMGISTSHLRARFRESCGVSVGRHVRRLRLEKARGLLRLSTRRVTEIADLCGFTSVYTFSRAFHNMYGVAPLEFRKGKVK